MADTHPMPCPPPSPEQRAPRPAGDERSPAVAAAQQGPKLTIAISGASGFIGQMLVPSLTAAGHAVRRMVRHGSSGPQTIAWSPADGTIDQAALEGCDAVIHLAGENILGRWTRAKKQAIRDSRVRGTELIARTLPQLQRRPAVFISASGVGYYGNRGDDILTEDSSRGDDFLAEVCAAWEAAARPAAEAGVRIVHPRFGMVLDPRGGALRLMLPIFRLGAGGVVGEGDNYLSWITGNDLAAVIHRLIRDEQLHGPMNVTAPNPVTSRELTLTLGQVLSRPTFLPAPRWVMEAVFGADMVASTIAASQRALPHRLTQAGHTFRHAALDEALSDMLGR